jgi:hypothetical protein
MIVPYQIYRHFKGHVVMILSIATEESTLEPKVIYMHLNERRDVWSRSLSEFESLVPEGKDNPTGQKHRFELVKDLRSILSQCTTENLVEELKKRPDSPFNESDVDGLNDKVLDREYILGDLRLNPNVGEGCILDSVHHYYLNSLYSADSLEEVQDYAERHFDRLNVGTKIFKSVLVEVQSFD